jgi:hypothetical protein
VGTVSITPLANMEENNIEWSTPFVPPPEFVSPEIWEIVQERSNDMFSGSISLVMTDMLNKLANHVLPAHNPRLSLTALFYAADVDVSFILGCENTETSIAKAIGVGKQTFNSELKKVRTEFGLYHSTGIKHGVTKETYTNNAKKIKPR